MSSPQKSKRTRNAQQHARRRRKALKRKKEKFEAIDEERRKRVVERYGEAGYQQCARKTRYKSKYVAEREANIMSVRSGTHFRAYWCHMCGGWHLTSKPDRHSHTMSNESVAHKGES